MGLPTLWQCKNVVLRMILLSEAMLTKIPVTIDYRNHTISTCDHEIGLSHCIPL